MPATYWSPLCTRLEGGPHANHICLLAAAHPVSNILQKQEAPPADAPVAATGEGQSQEAVAERVTKYAKIRAALEEALAYQAKHGPVAPGGEQPADQEWERIQGRIQELVQEQIQRRIQGRIQEHVQERIQEHVQERSRNSLKEHAKYENRAIKVNGSIKAAPIDMSFYFNSITYADLFPWMYKGKNVKPAPVPRENFPYLGDSVRVIKKGSCGCEHCCSYDFD